MFHYKEHHELIHFVFAFILCLLQYYFDKLGALKYAVTGWPGIVSSICWTAPGCDFAYMISTDDFNEFFLDGIREECSFSEASIFHLDGKWPLKHLGALLGIENLSSVQWVYGAAGQGCASDWPPVYRKVQAAGKGIQIGIELDELDVIMRELRPEWAFLNADGVEDEETFSAVLRQVAKWK